MTNQTLLILGMHRSGTSLVSNWIHECGVNLGDRLLGATPSNLYGHYEDSDFLDLHIQILTENGFDNDGLIDIGEISINKYFKSKIKSNVELKNRIRSQWGWKEPRTCLFLKEYHEIIENPTYLILFRSADEVVDSLLRRKIKEVIATKLISGWREVLKVKLFKKRIEQGIKKEFTLSFFKAWLRYNNELLNFIRKLPEKSYRVVSFYDLLERDKNVLDWISERGFDITHKKFDTVYDDKIINTKPVNLSIDSLMRQEVDKIRLEFESLI